MEINEGSLVRYTGTGTVGVVKVIREDDDGIWALLDSTGLFYHISVLEPIEKAPERKEIGPATIEDFQQLMKAKEQMMADAKMQDENLETGG